jgi:hypothetical protein
MPALFKVTATERRPATSDKKLNGPATKKR